MQSTTYTLFRNAILGAQQVACFYDGRVREGRWHEGGLHRTTRTCVRDVDLDINIRASADEAIAAA